MNRQGASKETGQRERLSEGGYMYCLYWIKLKDHTDIWTHGYVGITTNLKERIRAHKKNRRNTHFTNARNKYGWKSFIIEVLIKNLSQEDALFLESFYRPTNSIGWNSQQGGNLGVESSWYLLKENSDKHRNATSLATRQGILEKDSSEARSTRAKESWQKTRDKRVLAVTGENNPKAKLTESQVREIKYNLIPDGKTNMEISKLFNVEHYVISFIRSGKTWSHV